MITGRSPPEANLSLSALGRLLGATQLTARSSNPSEHILTRRTIDCMPEPRMSLSKMQWGSHRRMSKHSGSTEHMKRAP